MDNEFEELDATVLLAQPLNYVSDIDLQSEGKETDMSTTDHLARFQFIGYFAAGGMGQVGRARDIAFDRFVAVKSLHDKCLDKPLLVKSFLDECRLNAQLDHPSIVPVYAMGKSAKGNWEVIMKLINGTSLSQFIKQARTAYEEKKINSRQEQYALSSRLEYFLKICEVIDYCHSRNIIHGDLKPDNIMIGHFGEVYVMDWGCSRVIGTVPERIAGTPSYLPPEYLKDHRVTPLIDIYSLGMLLFELVTLLRSKMGTTDSKTTGNRSRQDIEQLENWHYHSKIKVRPEIRAIIRKALNPDPHRRYQSVKELSSDVRHFIYNEEVSAYPDNFYRKGVRWLCNNQTKFLLAIFLLIGTFCLLLFYSYYQVNRMKQHRKDLIMERIQFQKMTDDLAGALDRNLFLAQGKIMMFADNLIESSKLAPDYSLRFYDNDDYKDPAVQPPMQMTEYYYNPVNVENMVRFPIQGSMDGMLGAKQYIYICNKIIGTEIDSHDVAQAGRGRILSPDCMVQRLFVSWANGVKYSYPGIYDDSTTKAYKWRWDDPDNYNREKKIIWGAPYHANIDEHRIVCRYPMFESGGQYLGIAALEFRLEKVLNPAFESQPVGPGLRYFIIEPKSGRVAMIDGKKIVLLDEDQKFPDGTRASDIVRLAKILQNNRFRQLEVPLGDKEYVMSGARLNIVDAIFLQLGETELR